MQNMLGQQQKLQGIQLFKLDIVKRHLGILGCQDAREIS